TEIYTLSLHDALPISVIDTTLPIECQYRGFMHDAEACNAGQFDEIAPVASLGELRDAADAADLVQVRLIVRAGMCSIGLDHANRSEEHTSELQSRSDL